MSRRRLRATLIGLGLVAVLSACGVTTQQEAEVLPPNALPAPLVIPTPPAPSPSASTPASTPAPVPASRLRLWFVQDDGLAAVESDLPAGTSPDLILQFLALGPDLEQAADGVRTVARDPLTGQALVSVAPATEPPGPTALPTGAASGPPPLPVVEAPAAVTVTLTSAFSALPPAEQVLLLGQVVLSLTGAGEESVAFADESGSRVAVPLPDGRLLADPATARDYASLIVKP